MQLPLKQLHNFSYWLGRVAVYSAQTDQLNSTPKLSFPKKSREKEADPWPRFLIPWEILTVSHWNHPHPPKAIWTEQGLYFYLVLGGTLCSKTFILMRFNLTDPAQLPSCLSCAGNVSGRVQRLAQPSVIYTHHSWAGSCCGHSFQAGW